MIPQRSPWLFRTMRAAPTTATAAPDLACDPAAIRQALALLIPSGAVAELRVLGVPRVKVVSGYFDDPAAACRAAVTWSGRANGVYLTINEVEPALLARASNRMVEAPEQTTSDRDILRRRWLYVDADPVRAAGISATDAEHAAALERVEEMVHWLSERGWPQPVRGDSGNGALLLYSIDLPADAASLELVGRCLDALAFWFSDEAVAIDTSVKNAGRIMRLFGTLNAKGDSTLERPHRMARLLQAPTTLTPVGDELLQELAALAPPAETQGATRRLTTGAGLDDVGGWLAAAGIEVLRAGEWQGGRRWIIACPWNEAHRDGAAFVLRFPSGALAAGCHHAGCAGQGWRELRALVEGTNRTNLTSEVVEAARLNSSNSFNSYRRTPPWPVLSPEALYGVAGEIVRALEPATEADPAALLVRTVLTFGSCAGRGPHASVESDRHGLNENAVVVGETGKARKDTTRGRIDGIFARIDPIWAAECQATGLSSGEGLIHAVRDGIEKAEPVKERGRLTGEYVTVVVDEGVADKRLLINESEFARTLKVILRETNTLSAIVRDAWDGRSLRVMTRTSPLRATEPHVSILANITQDELRRHLSETDVTNGFLNRFLLVCARRSKLLPEGGGTVQWRGALERLGAAVRWAQEKPRLLTRDAAARRRWAQVYAELSTGRGGLFGAATNRAEAHVLRLSCLYAAMDLSDEVQEQHLRAAFALWRYWEDSARFIFGDAVGDPVADRILQALAETPAGMTRTDLHASFGRNVSAGRLDTALILLLDLGRVTRTPEPSESGRVVDLWCLTLAQSAPSESGDVNLTGPSRMREDGSAALRGRSVEAREGSDTTISREVFEL